jgi:hypothetical protein
MACCWGQLKNEKFADHLAQLHAVETTDTLYGKFMQSVLPTWSSPVILYTHAIIKCVLLWRLLRWQVSNSKVDPILGQRQPIFGNQIISLELKKIVIQRALISVNRASDLMKFVTWFIYKSSHLFVNRAINRVIDVNLAKNSTFLDKQTTFFLRNE